MKKNERFGKLKNEFEINNSIFQSLSKIIPLGILIIDKNGHYLHSNDALDKFLDTPKECFGKKEISEILKDKIKNSKKLWNSNTGEKIEIQFKNEKYFEVIFNILDFGNNSPLKVFWFRDLSEEKRKLEILENYLDIMDHELRTPLATIVSWFALLRNSEFSLKERNDIFFNLEKSGYQVLSLAENYLYLLKIEQGVKVNIEKKKFPILSLVREINQIFTRLGHRNLVEIFFTNPENEESNLELANYQIFIEKSLFVSMLNNLINNACEASRDFPEEKISVNFYRENGNFCLSISNFGKIPDSVQKKLFKKFVSSKKQGNGLGLFSARLIAHFHGGDLVYKDLSRGTRFTIQLPSSLASLITV